MSERRIGEYVKVGDPVRDENTSLRACKGAPASIQPGAVVAMAEALEEVVRISDRKHDAWDRAKAALAMYNGEDV